MKRIVLAAAAALSAATLIATPASAASHGPVTKSDRPGHHRIRATLVTPTLVKTADFLVGCRDGGGVDTRTVDVVFRWAGDLVWQDTTGRQFKIVRDAQNMPWTCTDFGPVSIPADWTDD